MPENIPSLFLDSARKNYDSIAFRYFDGSWKTLTYAEFLIMAKEMASRLIALGISEGDRIAIVSENGPEWCASYMATLFCRCIAVPIDMQLGHAEIGNILSDSEAKIILFGSKTSEAVMKASEGKQVTGLDLDSMEFGMNSTSEPDLSAGPDEIASIIYTSGTTGNPKGVMLTHRNFCSDAKAVIQAGLVTQRDNVLSILPMHHTYPFMCTFIVPVFLGASITFGPGLKAADLASAIGEGVTVVVGVPRLFEMIRDGILSRIKEKRIAPFLTEVVRACGHIRRWFDINIGKAIFGAVHKNFGRVRFFASGGARLDPAVMRDLEALGFTVLEGYGLTETSPVITFNPISNRKPGSAGKALPGVELKIDGGEITVKGPMVMAGYYRNARATEENVRDGWFYTGDLGGFDDEEYLFITGRKKEVIVLSSGKNIYPEEVEKAYAHLPLIKEIGISGIDKNGVVDSIQAVVVPDVEYARRQNIGNISETLKWEMNEVTSGLPEYMRIKGFTLYADPLPRTPLGKLRRFMLKDILSGASGREERTPDASLMEDEVGRRVAGCIRAVTNEDITIRAEDNLELDLGFDSLKRIEFISSLEDSFSTSLPDTFISDVQTVADVISRIKDHVAGGGHGKATAVTWKEILEKEPPEEERRRAGFIHGLVETFVVRLLIGLMRTFFRMYLHMSVKGAGNIPVRGPYILASNHASYLDGFIVAAAIPFNIFRNLYFLGISRFFAGSIKQLFARISHVIPIDAETYLNRALQMSSFVLNGGKSLCIFPEGGRSFGDEVMTFKKGVGILAVEKGIPVIPIYIEGSAQALPRGAAFIKSVRIEVTFGKPLSSGDIEMKNKPADIDEYQFFADKLRERVIGLSKDRPRK